MEDDSTIRRFDDSKVLVSFCVKSYNQRRYLKAALEGAMAWPLAGNRAIKEI